MANPHSHIVIGEQVKKLTAELAKLREEKAVALEVLQAMLYFYKMVPRSNQAIADLKNGYSPVAGAALTLIERYKNEPKQ